MRIYHLETLKDDQAGPDSSLMLEQRFSHGHRRIRAAALAVSGLLLCLPFAIILLDQMARERLIKLVGNEPAIAIQLGLAAAIGLLALYFGLRELLRTMVRTRIVKIDRGHAIVEDLVASGRRFWQEPIRRYTGIRHLVQTRSSGPVHLLILEHAQQSRSICIAYETQISDQAISDAGRRYNLPVLSGRRPGIVNNLTAMLPTFAERPGRPAPSAT